MYQDVLKNSVCIQLEKVNHLVFFKGTEQEQEEAEAAEARNAEKLKTVFESVQDESVICAVIFGSIAPETSRRLFHVLHRSAKYESLQFTTGLLENDSFMWFSSDTETETPEKYGHEAAIYGASEIYLYK